MRVKKNAWFRCFCPALQKFLQLEDITNKPSRRLKFLSKKSNEDYRYQQYKLYLTGKVFGAGRNPADSVVQNLLSLLVSKGASPYDMSVQWTEMFLKTRGVEFIDFDFYKKELTFLSGQKISSKSVLTTEQSYMAKTITWSLTCSRSWLTGEPITYDETLVHHIYHDPNPPHKTLYGVDYETLNCLVALKGNKENQKVEGSDWKKYQDRFIYMWQQFKAGNFEDATRFWDKIYRDAFLRERTSRRYLTYWLQIL